MLAMTKKLSASNAYLRDFKVRGEGMWISAKTSSAIEGIHSPFARRTSRGAGRSIPIKGSSRPRNGAKSGESR
jgi:hypothetical protein